jgi:hypothetical protein
MSKRLAAMLVAVIIIASLLVAGCINIITPSPTPSVPTPIHTSTHNPVLESAANEWMSVQPLGWVHYGKKETWNGGNSVTILFIERAADNYSATPLASNTTLMVFATSKDAAKYIDSIDKSNYLWSDRPFDKNDSTIPTAIRALGVPSAYQNWYYIEGYGTHNEKGGDIYQVDNIVEVVSNWALS